MKTSKRLSQSASAPVAESTSHLLNYRLKQIELAKKRSINGMKLAQSNKIKRAQGLVKKPRSKSQKAGLILPVTRFLKKFKAMVPNTIIRHDAVVSATGSIEYLVAELLDLSSAEATESKHKRITPRHINLAIKKDSELNKLLQNATFSRGGVVPGIHPSLLKKVPAKLTKKADAARNVEE